jgi:hypothetical protein
VGRQIRSLAQVFVQAKRRKVSGMYSLSFLSLLSSFVLQYSFSLALTYLFSFQKIHDPRTVVEDYTLEMRASSETSKKSKSEGKGGKKSENDFNTLITSVLSVFSDRVEEMFFHDNGGGKFIYINNILIIYLIIIIL